MPVVVELRSRWHCLRDRARPKRFISIFSSVVVFLVLVADVSIVVSPMSTTPQRVSALSPSNCKTVIRDSNLLVVMLADTLDAHGRLSRIDVFGDVVVEASDVFVVLHTIEATSDSSRLGKDKRYKTWSFVPDHSRISYLCPELHL